MEIMAFHLAKNDKIAQSYVFSVFDLFLLSKLSRIRHYSTAYYNNFVLYTIPNTFGFMGFVLQ